MAKNCIICYTTKEPLWPLDSKDVYEDETTFLDKLQCFVEGALTRTEYTMLCTLCVADLNKAYAFKKKVQSSQEFWKTEVKCIILSDVCITDFEKTEDATENNVDLVSEDDTTDSKNISCEYNFNPTVDTNQETCTVKTGSTTSIQNQNRISLQCNETDDKPKNEPETIDNKSNLNVVQYTCNKCSDTFEMVTDLIMHKCHILEAEVKEKKKKEAIKKQSSKLFLKGQYRIIQETFKCCTCEVTFDKSWKLKKHNAKVHCEKGFKCSYCGKCFKTTFHLKEHQTCHTGEQNYLCTICGKKFQRLSSQTRHMRTHDAGAKVKKTPFLCTICGKNFPYSNGAQRHMRIHTGEKRYRCGECGRTFNQSTHLHVHQRTHTGEKPYMCNFCGDAFPLSASLRKHMKSHKESKSVFYQNLEPNLSETKVECKDEFQGYIVSV